ncbi:hypothetical protein PN836_013750 [Ningiella sp. W23]|uniref:hypothetical protein n=1 Tax=Ningiella sp. W23 TaxID=3023715 RepID=UPI0037570137
MFLFILPLGQAFSIGLSEAQKQDIAHQIYLNETGGKAEFLIAWNEGEQFLSLGIGHFIWFPEGLNSPFTETFPDLLHFLEQNGVALPEWLNNVKDCPWQTKAQFLAAQNEAQYIELRHLVENTFSLQLEFILNRQRAALPQMLAELNDEAQKQVIRSRFNDLSTTAKGLYALIDYVNFKGEGISETERYKGEGWGLLQVLSSMNTERYNLHQAFTQACIDVLSRRIKNSPQQEIEQAWLAGWTKRCQTYSI